MGPRSRQLTTASLASLLLTGCDAALSRWDRVRVEVAPAVASDVGGTESSGDGSGGEPNAGGGATGDGSGTTDGSADGSSDTGGDTTGGTTSGTTTGGTTTGGTSGSTDTVPPTAATGLVTTVGSDANPDMRYAGLADVGSVPTTVFFVWNAASDSDSGLRDYTVTWYATADCSGTPHSVTGLTSLSTSVSATDGDVRTFKVTAFDRAGLSTDSACSGAITIDTTPPPDVATLTVATGIHAATDDVTVTLTANADVHHVEIRRLPFPATPSCTTDNAHTDAAAKEYQTLPVTETFEDETGTAGQDIAYWACIFDRAGNATVGASQGHATTKSHILFASADNTLTGNLGGLSGADGLCAGWSQASFVQEIADDPFWRAVLSSETVDAKQRVDVLGEVASSDYVYGGVYTSLATSAANLWSAGVLLDNADETGALFGGATPTWTGTNASGQKSVGNTCSDWTSTAGTGQTGDAHATGTGWLNGLTADACTSTRRIYCMSQSFEMLRAVTGASLPHSIDLTLTVPAQAVAADRIDVCRRQDPGIPSVDCAAFTDGGVAYSVAAPVAGAVSTATIDDSVVANTFYNVRATFLDRNGRVIYTTVVQQVKSSP